LPRSAIEAFASLSAALMPRMHDLLERNADGMLSPLEREELVSLVQISQSSQVIALAITQRGGRQ
jgi:hypothetical protein